MLRFCARARVPVPGHFGLLPAVWLLGLALHPLASGAEGSPNLADFVGSTTRAFEYFGAVLQVVVPDQLRSAVRGLSVQWVRGSAASA
jgi:hypothetical protein